MFRFLSTVSAVGLLMGCEPAAPVNGLGACASDASKQTVLVLDYDDFGPQVMSYELIGNDLWQWETQSGGDPSAEYDIKVVAYGGVDLGAVKAAYPVSQESQQDYRYADYAAIMAHFDVLNKDLLDAPISDDLRATLQQTENKIKSDLCPE